MRICTSLGLLICCCAALAGCTASASKGPATTVSTPSVGRPQPPSSVQAALSREAFTPYAALGRSDNDGLAPNESSIALSDACMNAAGYPGGSAPFAILGGPANLAFSQPWGAWGYLDVTQAEQYGFRVVPGSALTALGIHSQPQVTDPASLPAAEQTAMGKCGTIVQDFTDQAESGSLAGIQTLSDDIYNDVLRDQAVKNATRAWSACMARNGYNYTDPQTAWRQELRSLTGGALGINVNQTVSASANKAQIAMAVADANCTQSTDLAGIYFAVQASYEQQLVNANQQALTAAVQQYRAAYIKEIGKLASLLKTAKVNRYGNGNGPAPGPSGKALRSAP